MLEQRANERPLGSPSLDMPVVLECQEGLALNCVLSNSFGFGGTNASLAFKRFDA